jgi:hypothetical protein
MEGSNIINLAEIEKDIHPLNRKIVHWRFNDRYGKRSDQA